MTCNRPILRYGTQPATSIIVNHVVIEYHSGGFRAFCLNEPQVQHFLARQDSQGILPRSFEHTHRDHPRASVIQYRDSFCDHIDPAGSLLFISQLHPRHRHATVLKTAASDHRLVAGSPQPAYTKQAVPSWPPLFSCLVGVLIAWIPRFDPSLASQHIKAVPRRPPIMLCFRQNCFRRNVFATFLVLFVFLKLALQDSLLWTLLSLQAAVRRCDAVCLLSIFP